MPSSTARRCAGSPDRYAAGAGDPHVGILFDVADIETAMDEEDDGSFDIILCLGDALNHLAYDRRLAAAAALARVADGSVFVSVRTAGGTPSLYAASVDRARSFR